MGNKKINDKYWTHIMLGNRILTLGITYNYSKRGYILYIIRCLRVGIHKII